MDHDEKLFSPTKYPKAYSYRKIVKAVMQSMSKEPILESVPLHFPPKEIEPTESVSEPSTINSPCGGCPMGPSFKIEAGDRKYTYHLKDGGKLIKLEKADGKLSYALVCVDGKRLFIERTSETASLTMTDPRGNVISSLAAEY
ncbi:unnamed protein product [Caenorhabditis auriculariae]|uniref:Uncharacterized protein n=1 Tax=Caenorhabditis auriculariae TaxID=2777116 RepID=A0A8S1HKW2_9PELO|nr:unnamed protein product [Caenorhabditis auriculariae]